MLKQVVSPVWQATSKGDGKISSRWPSPARHASIDGSLMLTLVTIILLCSLPPTSWLYPPFVPVALVHTCTTPSHLLHSFTPVALPGLQVSDHEVGEAIDVTTSLEHDLGGHGRALNLQHILLQHKVLAPCLRDVSLDGAACRVVFMRHV